MKDAIRKLSDDELEAKLVALATTERIVTTEFIAHLADLHRRHLAVKRGYSSLFRYCTLKLGYSPDEAMRRITVARLAADLPLILELLRTGKITITNVTILSPVLTPWNHSELLEKAAGRSKLEVEYLVASIAPRPDKRDHVQKLHPTQATPSTAALPTPPCNGDAAHLLSLQPATRETPAATTSIDRVLIPRPGGSREAIEPLSPGRVHFGFTADEEFLAKVLRAKKLLWHKFPQGRLASVFSQALEDLLDRRDPERQKAPRQAKPAAGNTSSRRRYIPHWVRSEVWKRDGGRCAFVASDSTRCNETSSLEYDHIIPFALGGPSDKPSNVRLLCNAHNQLLARRIAANTDPSVK